MITVVVTEKEYVKAREVFDAFDGKIVVADPKEQMLAATIRRYVARAAIVGVENYTGLLYEALSDGGIISRFGVGTDGIDKELAKAIGVTVTNTPGVLDNAVAELTMWLIGSLARNVSQLDQTFKQGEFSGQCGMEIRGKTLGLVGFGRIAQQVARMASFGFGMQVWAYDILPSDEFTSTAGLSYYTNDLNELLPHCDFVSSHLPSTDDTRSFFDAACFAMFKEGAYFVNTSRGGVVDEKALVEALASRLAGAALDVFEHEPYEPVNGDSDLRQCRNVILTPHVASNTAEANELMGKRALENVVNHCRRKVLQVVM